ncbi:GNAT family N-acetyltransferase [Kitasatospora sp. NPDC006697]|uniref:GNAT family N-acetyltransferase n=1 Tax=Kitasatospora sp. NPDC006697 TaxID=3364020 RepID=UPI003676F94B
MINPCTDEQPVVPLPEAGLLLRPWQPEDAGALLAAGEDLAIRQWNLLEVASAEAARGRIARMRERWRAGTGAVWAVDRGGRAVGLIGLNGLDLDPAVRGGELVYWLLPAARGAGLAVPVVLALSDWAFGELGLHRVRLCHAVANQASCRVAVGAGFEYEGTMRDALRHQDGWHDQHLHALVRGD